MSTKNERDEWAMRIVGAWLRDWRLAIGATQRLVAGLAGINQAHLCRIELGKRRPSGAPLGRILIALDWLSSGSAGAGPWARVDGRLPSHAARWGVGRPPAVVGREPLPPIDSDTPWTLAGPPGADWSW